MAYSVNTYTNLITSGSQAMFALKQALSSSNWIISGSSDGYVYSTNGDILTGAIDLENNSAWFTVVAPDDTHQWSFQRKTTNEDWIVKRSKAGMSGSVDATTPPADDEAVELINGTLFNNPINNWLISVVKDDGFLPTVTSSFYAFDVTYGGGATRTLLFDESLLSNTCDALDQDTYISAVGHYAGGWPNYGFTDGLSDLYLYKRVRHNMSAPANQRSWTVIYRDRYTGVIAYPVDIYSQIGLSPYTGNEILLPAMYAKVIGGTYAGFWGFSNNIKYTTNLSRANGQTLDTGTKYYIYSSGLWLPWDSSTPTI